MVESTREIAGKMEQETRFYITSLVLLPHLLGPIIRSHWASENSLHWVLDMIFREDECRVRADHAPAKLRHDQAHGLQPDPRHATQVLIAAQAQDRRLG